jgi:hypothetical protein
MSQPHFFHVIFSASFILILPFGAIIKEPTKTCNKTRTVCIPIELHLRIQWQPILCNWASVNTYLLERLKYLNSL